MLTPWVRACFRATRRLRLCGVTLMTASWLRCLRRAKDQGAQAVQGLAQDGAVPVWRAVHSRARPGPPRPSQERGRQRRRQREQAAAPPAAAAANAPRQRPLGLWFDPGRPWRRSSATRSRRAGRFCPRQRQGQRQGQGRQRQRPTRRSQQSRREQRWPWRPQQCVRWVGRWCRIWLPAKDILCSRSRIAHRSAGSEPRAEGGGCRGQTVPWQTRPHS